MGRFLVHFFIHEDVSPLTALLVAFIFALALTLLTEWLHFRMSLKKALLWIKEKPFLCFASAMAITSWLMFLSAVSGSFALAFGMGGAIAALTAYVDLQLQVYRHKPFVPRDIAMALNLNQLAAMVSPGIVTLALLALLLIAVGCQWLYFLSDSSCWTPWPRFGIGTFHAVIFAGFLFLGKRDNPMRGLMKIFGADFECYRINTFGSYDENGYLISFLEQVFAPVMHEPEGYSRERVEMIARKYMERAGRRNTVQATTAQKPNIVFVMSEAFSDPGSFADIKTSEDPIPFIRALMSETPSGLALCPGYGGGTAHCECEALTGLSTALCKDLSPYETRIAKRKSFPSFVKRLKSEGYKTVALHPYNDSMYSRPEAYASLGFERFIIDKDMTRAGKPDNSPYISDAAAYSEALGILEQSEAPVFIHLVTMQNHGGYRDGRFVNTIKAECQPDSSISQLETYFQGLRYTDDATREFLQGLKTQGRDSVVLFWGDHLPFVYPEDIIASHRLKKFLTPVFFWSAGGMPYSALGIRSPMFFSQMLSAKLGFAATGFDMLREALGKELHGIHMDFTVDGGDTFRDGMPSGKAGELLAEYMMIQYDLLEGGGFVARAGFFEPVDNIAGQA